MQRKRLTPETDAFVAALNGEWDEQFVGLVELAKKLERERDDAREAFAIATSNCAGAQQSLRQARDRCWKLGRERNHWKRESLLQARLLAMSDVREERLRESLRCLLNPQCAVEEAAK